MNEEEKMNDSNTKLVVTMQLYTHLYIYIYIYI